MQVNATLKRAHISAQKCRLVADAIRGRPVDQALNMLTFSPKKSAEIIRKVLMSAVSNAEHNEGADVDELRVERIFVDEGPTAKRWRPRARGRADQILKRTCHITVTVSDGR